jgi:ribosomal protein L24
MVGPGDRVVVKGGKYRGRSGTVKTVGQEFAVVVIDDSSHTVGFAFRPEELEITLAVHEWKVMSRSFVS